MKIRFYDFVSEAQLWEDDAEVVPRKGDGIYLPSNQEREGFRNVQVVEWRATHDGVSVDVYVGPTIKERRDKRA